jgi:hypothetical protein
VVGLIPVVAAQEEKNRRGAIMKLFSSPNKSLMKTREKKC